jgi:LAO/AO transport system kinase
MESGSSLAERIVAGEARAVARGISLAEDEGTAGGDLVRAIFAHTGRAYLVGVTGPPGAGKSTLVDRLTTELRHPTGSGGLSAGVAQPAPAIGILAVDPTSPFTGGAVLGDRLRMQSHAGDEGVFIRSMATRGHLGGLARATGDAALVLDASGKNVVIIETVGVGQDEVEIVRTADVSIVTLVPGTGDDVQALKAGIMEIADVFVVNKSDREGADRLVSAIETSLSLHEYSPEQWRPPIVKTVATTGEGVPALIDAVWRFREHSRATQTSRRRARYETRVRELVAERLMKHLEHQILSAGEWDAAIERVNSRELDPYSAADLLVRSLSMNHKGHKGHQGNDARI